MNKYIGVHLFISDYYYDVSCLTIIINSSKSKIHSLYKCIDYTAIKQLYIYWIIQRICNIFSDICDFRWT